MTAPIVVPNQSLPPRPLSLPGISISSTQDILNDDTRLAMMVWGPSGVGKTRLAGSLHSLTMEFMGKPTLYIAVESAEGGGAVTIRDMNIPLWTPKSWKELESGLQALKGDKQFGGIVVDSASDVTKRWIKDVALKYPCREKSPVITGPRGEGIPAQSDYQVMGELARQMFNSILNISSNPDPALKKHVLVTALDKTFTDEDSKRITWHGPSLPGAAATESVGMFQIVGTIELRTQLKDGKRCVGRYLKTQKDDGADALKDRFNIFPKDFPLKDLEGKDGMDLKDMWKNYWLPAVEKAKKR